LEVSSAAKVGMITVLALIILGLAYSFLYLGTGGKLPRGTVYHIVYARVEGLTEGAPVRRSAVIVRLTLRLTSSDRRLP
jgi:ABC-type transporter Mla subunit MlaD